MALGGYRGHSDGTRLHSGGIRGAVGWHAGGTVRGRCSGGTRVALMRHSGGDHVALGWQARSLGRLSLPSQDRLQHTSPPSQDRLVRGMARSLWRLSSLSRDCLRRGMARSLLLPSSPSRDRLRRCAARSHRLPSPPSPDRRGRGLGSLLGGPTRSAEAVFGGTREVRTYVRMRGHLGGTRVALGGTREALRML